MGVGLLSGEPTAVLNEEAKPRFLFEQGLLVMTAEALCDANGSFSLAQLPNPKPKEYALQAFGKAEPVKLDGRHSVILKYDGKDSFAQLCAKMKSN